MPTIPSLSSSLSALKPTNLGAFGMGTQTSTPATSLPKGSIFSAPKPVTPAVPKIAQTPQSSDTVLTPGQFGAGPFATIKPDGTSEPSAYVKSFQQPAVPTIAPPVKTTSGAIADPNTGGMIAPAIPQQQQTPIQAPAAPEAPATGGNTGNAGSTASYSASAGGAPSTYGGGGSYNPLITSPETEDLFKKYMESLKPSDEETQAQERLNTLTTAAAKGYTDTQNQPIALPFITGQQAAIQRSENLLSQPLEKQIALLQAKRQISSTASKAALDRADTLTKARRELATSTVSVPFGSTAAQFNQATGKFEPIGGGAFGAGDTAAQDSWVNLIKGGQAKLDDVPQQIRQGVAEKLATSPTISKANQDAFAQADTVIQKVDEIVPTINATNAGVAAYLASIKGTPQYNLAAQLDTIKSNVGFAALQAMRAASPTGGALGQVSEQENRLLQSTLASLDQGQSPDQLKANLAKVKLHFENLKQILNAPINSQASYDAAGNVVITAPPGGAFSPTQQQGTSGSIYDF